MSPVRYRTIFLATLSRVEHVESSQSDLMLRKRKKITINKSSEQFLVSAEMLNARP